jgi:LysR family transcriptional activator of mexEF-oprN operon
MIASYESAATAGLAPQVYGRDLDLNLLRTFVVVAECQSVTRAADRLYLTQPAISAALRRLTRAVGAPLLARQGRGVVLTRRGERLLETARPHLQALAQAALSPARFDPGTSERVLRLGLSDTSEGWLLPPLLQAMGAQAPGMRLVVLPVQFRSVAQAITTRQVDLAVTVADEMPAGIARRALYQGAFVCLFDPRHHRVRGGRISSAEYFAGDHVIVSYNGDLRGVVEDLVQRRRRVRCSLPSFGSVGAVIDGTALLATVPELVAREVRRTRPHLRTAELPFALGSAPMELLWPAALDDDEAASFVRGLIAEIAARQARRAPAVRPPGAGGRSPASAPRGRASRPGAPRGRTRDTPRGRRARPAAGARWRCAPPARGPRAATPSRPCRR